MKTVKVSDKVEPRQTDIFSFINEKLRICDVEPMYVAIHRSGLSRLTKQKLCLAEGLADHLGLAAQMAEGSFFWVNALKYVQQPLRGGARRHFRGRVAVEAVHQLSSHYPDVSDFFDSLPSDFHEARDYICDLPQFGFFSAFKIADMAERTCGCTIDFSKAWLADLAKFPRRGLTLAAQYLGTADVEGLLCDLQDYKWDRLAPPLYDRPLNLQEIETCLCNYGHKKWHPPGYEGRELRKLLEGFGPIARRLQDCLPNN